MKGSGGKPMKSSGGKRSLPKCSITEEDVQQLCEHWLESGYPLDEVEHPTIREYYATMMEERGETVGGWLIGGWRY